MAQDIYTMSHMGKVVLPTREVLKYISLSILPKWL